MEMASTHAKLLIEMLLNVHGLANMHRSSGNDEYRKCAADWLPKLESQMFALKNSLTPEHPND